MSDILKAHGISFLQTFVAAFLTVLGASIASAGTLQWTSAFWVGLLLAAVRAAVKEAFAQLAPVSLGGRAR